LVFRLIICIHTVVAVILCHNIAVINLAPTGHMIRSRVSERRWCIIDKRDVLVAGCSRLSGITIHPKRSCKSKAPTRFCSIITIVIRQTRCVIRTEVAIRMISTRVPRTPFVCRVSGIARRSIKPTVRVECALKVCGARDGECGVRGGQRGQHHNQPRPHGEYIGYDQALKYGSSAGGQSNF
jgi:hypothetical protein